MSEILKLAPAFKDYIWGGNIIKAEYNVKNMDRVAEAWVLSAHPDGESTVIGGTYNNMPFTKAVAKMGKEALGKNAEAFEDFPQLIKLIDAQDNLSVQVHPDDEYALKVEGQFGKTEMWYILGANEGAGIYYGFKEQISKEEFKEHIENNTLEDILEFVPVKAGQCFFIPAGTIHAIGKGLLIAEIQQNSNVTYRVYDYGRVDKNGNTRPLHIEKAVEVTSLCPAPEAAVAHKVELSCGTSEMLASCKYFTVTRLNINGETEFCNKDSFTAVLITEGSGTINGIPFEKNDTFFVPADIGKVKLIGDFQALLSVI